MSLNESQINDVLNVMALLTECQFNVLLITINVQHFYWAINVVFMARIIEKAVNLYILFNAFLIIFNGNVSCSSVFNVSLIMIVLIPVLTATMTNSKDPDEMLHDAVFYQGLHCL